MSMLQQWTIFGNTNDLQKPYDVAVVMPTVGRLSAIKAVQSVYQQKNVTRIQLLIGVDIPGPDMPRLLEVLKTCPSHVTVMLFYPGYSTSVRHGGMYLAKDGGGLRSILTCLANAKYVAYLDDDNWWDELHLSDMLAAVHGRTWAFSLRWFVDPAFKVPLCIDDWESVGPGRGVYVEQFGGFVDPNCLITDKTIFLEALTLWTCPLDDDEKGMSADRRIYDFLQKYSAPGKTNRASVFYVLDPHDDCHPGRLENMGRKLLEKSILNA